MADREGHGYGVILLTFMVAYVLAILPLPPLAAVGSTRVGSADTDLLEYCPARACRYRHRIVAWCGLDVLEGAVMGQNALALMVVVALSLVLYQRLRVYSLGQQAGVVFILVAINQLICQWVQNLEGIGAGTLSFLLPAVSSALLWPVVFHLLRGLRRRYRVN